MRVFSRYAVFCTALVGALVGASSGKAAAFAPGATCTLKSQLTLSAKSEAVSTPAAILAKGASLSIVTITAGWAQVRSGPFGGAVKLKDLRHVCRDVTPPATHDPGSVCRLRTRIKLGALPRAKGKRIPADIGADLTVVGMAAGSYRVTIDKVVAYALPRALDTACVWQTKVETSAAPDATPSVASSSVAEVTAPAVAGTGTGQAGTPADLATSATDATSKATLPELAPAPLPAPQARSKGEDSGKTKIAVMDLRHADNIDKNLVQSLGMLIPQELDQTGAFKAISSQDINQMLALEAMKDRVGCDSASCLAEIGGALGADYMVSGSILLADQIYLIQLQLMNIAKARIDGRATREYRGGPAGLFDEVRTATKLLVRDILVAQSGRLLLVASEEGATIRIDGTIVGTSPMAAQAVPGGMHTIVVEKEGFIRFGKDVEITANEEARVDAPLRPSVEFLQQYQARTGLTRGAAWTSVIVAAAGLGGGAALYLLAGQKAAKVADDIRAYNQNLAATQTDFNKLQQSKKSVATLDAMTLGAGALGVAAGVTSAVLFAFGDDPHRYDRAGEPAPVASEGHPSPAWPSWSLAITMNRIGLVLAF